MAMTFKMPISWPPATAEQCVICEGLLRDAPTCRLVPGPCGWAPLRETTATKIIVKAHSTCWGALRAERRRGKRNPDTGKW